MMEPEYWSAAAESGSGEAGPDLMTEKRLPKSATAARSTTKIVKPAHHETGGRVIELAAIERMIGPMPLWSIRPTRRFPRGARKPSTAFHIHAMVYFREKLLPRTT